MYHFPEFPIYKSFIVHRVSKQVKIVTEHNLRFETIGALIERVPGGLTLSGSHFSIFCPFKVPIFKFNSVDSRLQFLHLFG